MKNKTILLGILAILVIIFLFCGSFFSWKEGMGEDHKQLIIGWIKARKRRDNTNGTLTDDTIIKNILALGITNSEVTNILNSMTSSKDGVDKFAQIFGQGIYDALEDSLVIHYTFDKIDNIDNLRKIKNNTTNNFGASPRIYDAVIYTGTVNPQPISTIIDKKNTAVNPSCLFLNGLPRTDRATGGNADNGAYLMIPTLPTFHDSATGFLGMSFSLWFCATDENAQWSRIFDFGNDSASDNILVSPSCEDTQILACLMLKNDYGNLSWVRYTGEYASDSIWRHLVWTVATDGKWTIYINNRVVSNNKHKYIPRNITRQRNYIGKSNWNSTSSARWTSDDMYNGWIDDFRIYQRELTGEDVNALYSKGGKVQQKDNHVWVMPATKDQWYKNDKNTRIGYLTQDLGILSNTYMTIAFRIKIPNIYSQFRNVFLIGNDTSHATRLPALYIHPNSNRLHFRFSHIFSSNPGMIHKDTIDNWNDDDTYIVPLNTDTHITYVLEKKTIKFYVNGDLRTTGTLPARYRRVNNTPNTSLYMNLHNNSQDILLKNFQIFNRSLLPDEVRTVYSQLTCIY